MIRRRVVVFVRAPRLGVGKRRLARDIGDLAALRFERIMLTALSRRLGRDRRWRVDYAVTPHKARRTGRLWPGRAVVFAQGAGDLGVRMQRALAASAIGPAVLVGVDIPALAAHHVAEAFRLLGRCDIVFGPAVDGGFWLVGARHPGRLPRLFGNVRWSGPDVFEDVVSGLPPRLSIGFAARLADVDDGASWRRAGPPRGF